MEKQKLIGKIYEIHSKIRKSIPYINSGGCARFAIRTHIALNKLGIENEMHIDSDSNIEDDRWKINNLSKLDSYQKDELSFNHAWIFIPSMNMCFDGEVLNQDVKSIHRYHSHGIYNQDEMSSVIRVGDWNSMYDIKNNKRLSNIIYKTIK